jgi:hypothetical protein
MGTRPKNQYFKVRIKTSKIQNIFVLAKNYFPLAECLLKIISRELSVN